MSKILINFLTIIFLILLTNCGYKINKIEKNYYIVNLDIEGERKNSAKLKNYLIENNDVNVTNKLSLEIDLQSSQSVKAKSKTGSVTSYNLSFVADAEFKIENKITKKNFVANTSYELGTNHSTTIYNEKKAKDDLLRDIAAQILDYLNFRFKNAS